MRDIWSQHGRVRSNAISGSPVMKAQRDSGCRIPADAIKDYERVKEHIDLASIAKRERVTLHDVKARIEEFSELQSDSSSTSGSPVATSRKTSSNSDFRALKMLQVQGGGRAASRSLGRPRRTRPDDHGTHAQRPAQPTTFGKRLAMSARIAGRFHPRRGAARALSSARLKGAVGTPARPADAARRQRGESRAARSRVIKHLGFKPRWARSGRFNPRSLDFDVVSALHQLGAAAASCATTLRLMAGAGLLTEGFQEARWVPRRCRTRSTRAIASASAGFRPSFPATSTMTGRARRPPVERRRRFLLRRASRGAAGCILRHPTPLETYLTVLRQMRFSPPRIAAEKRAQLPFLATTTILNGGREHGAGRETAHESIKEHALAAAKARARRGDADLLSRLAATNASAWAKSTPGDLGGNARSVGAGAASGRCLSAE